MSKLAYHFLRMTPWARELVATGGFRWAKVFDPGPEDPWPGLRTIGRVKLIDEGIYLGGRAGAESWYARVRPDMERARWVYCWELTNEPVVNTRPQRLCLVEYTLRAVELLHRDGFRAAAGCFARGTPQVHAADPESQAVQELGPLFEACDYLALHEYGPGSMQKDAAWHVLRHRHLVDELRAFGIRVPPILITEFGIDGPGGWRTLGVPWESYREQLIWAAEELDKDPEVECATIYTSGATADWEGFAIEEAEARWLAGYVRETGEPVARPYEPPAPPAKEEPMDKLVIDGRCMTPAEFAAFVAGLKIIEPYDRVVIHHTAIPTEESWQGAKTINAMRKHYELVRKWSKGPHLFIGPEGIWLFWTLARDGYGVENGNKGRRHIEIVGNYTDHLPSGATLDNAVAAAAILLRKIGRGVESLSYHRLHQLDTSCPGDALVDRWPWFKSLVAAALQPEPAPDVAAMATEARWNVEEAVRELEAGGLHSGWPGMARLHSLIRLDGGLMYRLENALKAR